MIPVDVIIYQRGVIHALTPKHITKRRKSYKPVNQKQKKKQKKIKYTCEISKLMKMSLFCSYTVTQDIRKPQYICQVSHENVYKRSTDNKVYKLKGRAVFFSNFS